jgi:putative chitinase
MLDQSDWLSRFLMELMRFLCGPEAPAPDEVAAQDSVAAGSPAAPVIAAAAVASAAGVPIVVAPTLAPTSPMASFVTPTLLHLLGVRDTENWLRPIAAACGSCEIDTPRRVAAFMANIMVETSSLSTLVESLNYSPEGLLKTWPNRFTPATAQSMGRTASKPANQRAIAEAAYGGRLGNGPPGSGDGWMFRGRGLIQLTGRSNYQRFAKRVGADIETLPGALETPESAATSAAQFWQAAGCNQLADNDDIVAVRLAVNGGSNGLDKVQAAYKKACGALAIS